MIENIFIREYSKEDKSRLLEIVKQNIPKCFAESELADYDNYLDHETEKYYVICEEEKIIGAGGINFEGFSAIISWDVIDPAYQAKGIGKKLLEYRISVIKSTRNIENIFVRTSQKTYRFYAKNGFQLKKVIKDYWADGFDLYYMEFI